MKIPISDEEGVLKKSSGSTVTQKWTIVGQKRKWISVKVKLN